MQLEKVSSFVSRTFTLFSRLYALSAQAGSGCACRGRTLDREGKKQIQPLKARKKLRGEDMSLPNLERASVKKARALSLSDGGGGRGLFFA